MSRKLIGKFENGSRVVRVYRDSEWNEYRAELSVCGQKLPDHTYFCTDKSEALQNGEYMAINYWSQKPE